MQEGPYLPQSLLDQEVTRSAHPDIRVNDFAFKLANVNGTGSASANGLLMQAIFRMGIPVSGKNLFPSNIQGLPTWYEIRVNKDGNTARALDYDLMVAMNGQTYESDVREVRQGGYLLYDSTWPLDPHLHRDDITFLGVPLAHMCNESFRDPRERILMKNIAYAGALVAVLHIDIEIVEQLLEAKFAGKKALRESNRKALRLGLDYAKGTFCAPAVPSREDGRQPRQDSHRRQHGHCARLRIRRGDGGGLVSYYTLHFRDGRLQGILR
jgi:2-oxoglutarate ferredoxin oxidoreductase subunit alpha